MKLIRNLQEYFELIQTQSANSDYVLFYDHRLGIACQDPHLFLIPIDDHLVHRGDGVFETLKFKNKKVYLLEEHLQRLQRSARAIDLKLACSLKELKKIILELCRLSQLAHGIISIFAGRGPGGFSVDWRECTCPSLYVVIRKYQLKPESFWEKGVTACKVSIPAKQPYLAKMKTVNYLPNVLMKKEAVEKGYDYPFCFDERGFLAEGCTENVIIVDQQGKIVVPELQNALSGTTLMRALELIKQEQTFLFRPIVEGDIYEAREVILLGTTIDALSVVRYNDQPIYDVRPGPVSKRLRELLLVDQENYGLSFD